MASVITAGDTMPAMSSTKISIVIACLVAATPAYAHFKLETPSNWTNLSTDGTPQKVPPCGNEGNPSNTGPVTEYKAGQTIDIAFEETVFHAGHYRVSIAANQAALPADPDDDVVADSKSECGSLAINPAPAMPLIADGVLVHTARFTGMQTAKVTLPAGMTCDHCVLQVVEFMSNHSAPCFYHHCANIKISTTGPAGGGVDAGPTGGDAGVGGGGGGGGCSVAGKDVTGVALLALTVGLVLARRRRR